MSRKTDRADSPKLTSKVTVIGSARVHLGLLQMSTSFSVLNMGFGFALSSPRWVMRAWPASTNCIVDSTQDEFTHEHQVAAREMLDQLSAMNGGLRVKIEILESVMPHIGLGSKTTFLCSLLAAYFGVAGEPARWPRLRYLTKRGGTSGIGINLATCGGLILDSGHNEEADHRRPAPSAVRTSCSIPRIAGRWELPEWPLLLASLTSAPRICGAEEKVVFDRFLPLPKEESQALAALSMFELIPAATGGDYDWFSKALESMQEVGFKKREWSVQCADVQQLRRVALRNGATCVALTSMGPSLMIMGPDLNRTEAALRNLNLPALALIRTTPRNTGIEVLREA